MDKSGIVGEMFEQLGQAAKQVGKSVANTPANLAKTAVSQVANTKDPGSTEVLAPDKAKNLTVSTLGASEGSTVSENTKPQSDPVAEQKQLAETREKLKAFQEQHNTTYYNQTFNKPVALEERPTEKIEREKIQELRELQKKKEKLPEAVQQIVGKSERRPGASG